MKTPPLLYYPDFYPNPTWLRAVLLLNDEVSRIVPSDVKLDDPEPLREIAGELGALTRISPEGIHTEPYTASAEWMERAFGIISRESQSQKARRITLQFSGGHIEYPGNVLLRDGKLSKRVHEMLERYGLIDSDIQAVARELHGPLGGVIIPVAAANVVLSFIADSIARDRGLIAITDQTLDFAMNTLLGLNIPVRPPSGAEEGILAGVFASILVPREIGEIRFSDYKILRERSSELRAAFGKFVHAFSRRRQLYRIENVTRLQQEIERCGKEVATEFEKFHTGTSKSIRFVRDWWPLMIGGVLEMGKHVFPVDWGLTFGAGVQAVKIVHQINNPSPDRDKEKVYNLAAAFGRDINALPTISQLINLRDRR